MSAPTLCLGGPMDGRLFAGDADNVDIPQPSEDAALWRGERQRYPFPTIRHERYRRTLFTWEGAVGMYVYLHEGINPDAATYWLYGPEGGLP